MAGRKLAVNVWLDGVFHAAGSTPEKDAADRITNPKAWGKAEAEPKAERPASAEKSSKSEK